jgi:hypothetical protein
MFGPFSGMVHDGEDHHPFLDHGIGDDIRRARNDEFAGIVDTAGPAEVWMVREPTDRGQDRGMNASCRVRIMLGDVAARRLKVVERHPAPDDIHPV